MRLLQSLVLAGAAVASSAACTPAFAGSIIVTEGDGGGTLTIAGTAPGLDVTFGAGSVYNVINGNIISPTLPVSMPTFHFVGDSAYMTATSTQTITDGADTVTLGLSMQAAVLSLAGSEFLDIASTITSVTETDPGGGTYNWTYLYGASFAVDYTGSALKDLVNNPTGNPIFTNGIFNVIGIPVPEPPSVVLLGMGASGLAGVYLRRKRSS